MDKLPIEVFLQQQLLEPRHKSIIAQLGVDPVMVHAILVSYFRDQGVHSVSPTLAGALAEHMAEELEHRCSVQQVEKTLIQEAKKIKTVRMR